MDEWIQQLEEITSQCVDNLDELVSEDIEQFIEQRDEIIEHIRASEITEAVRIKHGAAIARILQYDPPILAKMESLKSGASAGLNKVSTARLHKNAYDATYTMDSIYFDKKK